MHFNGIFKIRGGLIQDLWVRSLYFSALQLIQCNNMLGMKAKNNKDTKRTNIYIIYSYIIKWCKAKRAASIMDACFK